MEWAQSIEDTPTGPAYEIQKSKLPDDFDPYLRSLFEYDFAEAERLAGGGGVMGFGSRQKSSVNFLQYAGDSKGGRSSTGGGFTGGISGINIPTISKLQDNKFTVFVDKSSSIDNSMKNEIVRRHESNPLSELNSWSDMVLSSLNQFNSINRIGIDFNNCKLYANSLFSDRNPYYGYIQDRGNVRLFGPILRNAGYITLTTGLIIEADDYLQGNQSLLRLGIDVSAMGYAFYLTGWNGILFGLTYSIGSNEFDREPIFGWNSGSRFLTPSDNTNVFINWRK